MFIKRVLDLPALLKRKSFFLFGPRATGKSSLVKAQFSSDILVINLLRTDMYMRLSSHPEQLEEIIDAADNQEIVVIDEVQRVPMLLNEVHRLIEDRGIRFLLTGSSARKLKSLEVNLLAGRAWRSNMFPLTYHELPDFDLNRYLLYGGLPPSYLSEDPAEELLAYVDTYLKEEIREEALVRKLPAFIRFIQFAALTSGQILNFSSVSNDAGVPMSTVKEYYNILEDTFLGFLVPAWTKSVKRKALSTTKFYLFDLGVKNSLAQIKSLEPHSDQFGQAFEHFIALELRAYLSYRRKNLTLCYWQAHQSLEVDFVIGDNVAIEVKASKNIQDKHFKGLQLLADENICRQYYLVSQDPINRKKGGFHAIYWRDFLDKLWSDEIAFD